MIWNKQISALFQCLSDLRQYSLLSHTQLYSVARCIQEAIDEKKLSIMKGQPALCIPEEQLATLLGYHFKVTDIARILMVSPRTIRRRIIQYGLEDAASYSDISDNDLDSISSNFVHHNPNSGLRSLEGLLRSQGIRIQRQRVRECLMRVDPHGMQARFGMLVRRRKYLFRIVCGTLMGIIS